jgi:maltose/maltodextrin transport system substrate-binding protein
MQKDPFQRLAIAAVAALGFAACAGAQGAGRLLVWVDGDKGYNGLQKVGDQFGKKTGVLVTVKHPDDALAKFRQAGVAGGGPDILCWPQDHLGEWAASGLIVPVHPSRTLRDQIDEQAWKAFTYRGAVWGYPLSEEAVGLVYNKALVQAPPRSFDEVFRLDRELQAAGKHAILWDYGNTYFTWPILAAGGGYVFGRNAQGRYDPADVGVNSPGAVKGADLLARLVREGVMPKGAGYAEMEAGFDKGDVAMMITGPWAWDHLRKNHVDFGVAPIPDVDGKRARPFVDVLGCMIASHGKSQVVAARFLESSVLALEGLRVLNADVPLRVPANKAFFKELSADPDIKATMESAHRGEPMPGIPEMSRFWSSMTPALEDIAGGRRPPKEALDAAAARMAGK